MSVQDSVQARVSLRERPVSMQDFLQASGADKLKNMGICSGDLLWIRMASTSKPAEGCQAPATAAPTPHGEIQETEAQGDTLDDNAEASRLGSCSNANAPRCLASAAHQAFLEGGLQHLQV
jgi:hypothetical protein